MQPTERGIGENMGNIGAGPSRRQYFSDWKEFIFCPAKALFNAFILPGAAASEKKDRVATPDYNNYEEWPSDINGLMPDQLKKVLTFVTVF